MRHHLSDKNNKTKNKKQKRTKKVKVRCCPREAAFVSKVSCLGPCEALSGAARVRQHLSAKSLVMAVSSWLGLSCPPWPGKGPHDAPGPSWVFLCGGPSPWGTWRGGKRTNVRLPPCRVAPIAPGSHHIPPSPQTDMREIFHDKQTTFFALFVKGATTDRKLQQVISLSLRDVYAAGSPLGIS